MQVMKAEMATLHSRLHCKIADNSNLEKDLGMSGVRNTVLAGDLNTAQSSLAASQHEFQQAQAKLQVGCFRFSGTTPVVFMGC